MSTKGFISDNEEGAIPSVDYTYVTTADVETPGTNQFQTYMKADHILYGMDSSRNEYLFGGGTPTSSGSVYRVPAAVVATSNVTVASPGATIDSYALSSGDRVLLTGQSAPAENGLWSWNGAAVPMTRTGDYEAASTEMAFYGVTVFIVNGTIGTGQLWRLTTTGTITIDTTVTAWTQNAATFTDSLFKLEDNSDQTKKAQFQLSGITTANTRIYTVPDYDATFATLAGVEVFANKTLTTPAIASFANATHDHTNAAGGGQLTDAALSAAVTVPKGGTGLATLTAHAAMIGNGASAVTFLAPSTSRNVMISDGTDWASRALVDADIPDALTISGGTINNSIIGGVTPTAATFTNVVTTGYLELPEQAAPGTPTNAARIFVDTSNRFSWKGENGFVRTFDGTANLADRIYVLPDVAGTVILNTYGTFTSAVTIAGSSDTVQLQVTGNATQTSVLQSWRNSTPTVVGSISNLGHAFFGSATAPLTTTVVSVTKSFADPAATVFGFDSQITFTYTGANSQVLEAFRGLAISNQTGANHTGSTIGVAAEARASGSTNTESLITALSTVTRNTGAGTLTNGYGLNVSSAINSGGGTFTNNYGIFVDDQSVGSTLNYALFTKIGGVSVLGSLTVTSAAGATWKGIEFRAATATITGSTNITTAAGFNYIDIARPTLSAGTALTITNAATVYIANSPLAGGAGPATITNAYSLWIDAGVARFDGNLDFSVSDTTNFVFGTGTGTKIGSATAQKLSFWNATPIIQPTTAIAAATFVANTSLIANDSATFDGYTIGQVVKALRNMGALA